MPVAHIKGAAVREFLGWYTGRVSPEVMRGAISRLPEDVRAQFDPEADALGVLPSTWYDSRAVQVLAEAVLDSLPEDERDESIREAARYAIDRSARGIYRFVIKRLSPEIYVRQTQRLWGMLHDSGEREMTMTGKNSCRSFTRNWPGHHPILCRATTETMARIFEIMGCKDVEIRRIACVSEGAPECVCELEWTR